MTWSDKRSGGNDADIWLAKSTDGGATWMRMDAGEISLWGAKTDPATVGSESQPAVPLSCLKNTTCLRVFTTIHLSPTTKQSRRK